MVQPEVVILAGAVLWGLAGIVTGIPKNNIPSGYPTLFFTIATIGGLIGVTEFVPSRLDVTLTFLAAALFVVTPVVATRQLLKEYPPDGPAAGVAPGVAEESGDGDST